VRLVQVIPHARARFPLAAAASVAAVALAAAGCASSTQGSAARVTATITVAATLGPDTAPLFVAKSDGAFARAGLTVKIRSYPSDSAELAALNSGQADIAAGDYVDFFFAQSQHPDLRIVADGYHAAAGTMEVLTAPGSHISTPQQLAGKTIGTPEPQVISRQQESNSKPYSLETLATQSVLESDGVGARQVTWDPMPTGSLITALRDHQVDAILAQEPVIFQAESELGAVEVLDSCSGATANLPLSGYFTVNRYASGHAAALREFQAVLQQAQADAVLPGRVRGALMKEPGMNAQTASLVTIGQYPTRLSAASLQRVYSLMFSFEMFPVGSHPVKVQSMIFR